MRKRTELAVLAVVVALPMLIAAAMPSAAGPAPAAAAGGAPSPGLTAFVDLKCSLCHSIESQGIERKSKSEKTKGPDLSTIGATHDAAWLTKFLRQEVANDAGKKHEKEFKGTPEQLQQVATFLASLKTK